MTDFDFGTLEHRLRELAFLNSGVRITWPTGAIRRQRAELFYEGGLEAFVRYLDRRRSRWSMIR
jgi:DNA gyrase subunit B